MRKAKMKNPITVYNRTKFADTHKCQWCGDKQDASECKFDTTFGWLCEECQQALMSRGEQLTIVFSY